MTLKTWKDPAITTYVGAALKAQTVKFEPIPMLMPKVDPVAQLIRACGNLRDIAVFALKQGAIPTELMPSVERWIDEADAAIAAVR